ncbi:hypothetical protein [Duganella fentianensis]|uniref:hypothetical protein n=1 Tax=Duganella fentianensis TaxID=2692177 RepID=UPI0032B1F3B6
MTNVNYLPISQKEARRVGLKLYFTSRPCARGHVAQRHTHNGVCIECGRENDARRYAEKGEQLRAQAVDRYWKDPERHREAKRLERLINPEKIRARDRARYIKNPQLRRKKQNCDQAPTPNPNCPPLNKSKVSNSKVCKHCNIEKPLLAFARHKNRCDGVQVYCRVCMKEFRDSRQYDKIRWANPQTRESEIARHKRYIEEDKEYWLNYWKEKAREQRLREPAKKKQWNITRRYAESRATPSWADFDAMNAIYQEARRLTLQDGIQRNVDHVIPLRSPIVCGLHVENNLRIIEKSENEKKRNKFVVETTIFKYD